MPNFTILGEFERGELARVVPPEYRALVSSLTRDGVRYTVVQYAHDRRDVADSAAARRSLAQIPLKANLLAIGANFTREALVLLEERQAAIARLGEFYWTDDSLHSQRFVR